MSERETFSLSSCFEEIEIFRKQIKTSKNLSGEIDELILSLVDNLSKKENGYQKISEKLSKAIENKLDINCLQNFAQEYTYTIERIVDDTPDILLRRILKNFLFAIKGELRKPEDVVAISFEQLSLRT